MASRLEYAHIVYAHADRDIAERYGPVGRAGYIIDAGRFLDSRTAHGAVEWRDIRAMARTDEQLAAELRRRGYAGVIYPDPHDWDDVDPVDLGPEIAIVSPDGIIWD